MNTPNYEDLDPGIRRTVKLLNDHGFETTDSGDGKTKVGIMECALAFPHVVISSKLTGRGSRMRPGEIAFSAMTLLEEVSGSFSFQGENGEGWWIESTNVLTSNRSVDMVMVVGFHDDLLPTEQTP